MTTACSLDMSVSSYQLKCHSISEDVYLCQHCCRNPKSYTTVINFNCTYMFTIFRPA